MVAAHDYLDQRLLDAMRCGIQTLEELTLATCDAWPCETAWRVVNNRLGALRARGIVNYTPGQGWAEELT